MNFGSFASTNCPKYLWLLTPFLSSTIVDILYLNWSKKEKSNIAREGKDYKMLFKRTKYNLKPKWLVGGVRHVYYKWAVLISKKTISTNSHEFKINLS